ncbi:PASTA domain-containing protein, partial [Micromonospora sp. DH15]|nr:PASTA domain-containing protein [Micromonospora sp. DH15]
MGAATAMPETTPLGPRDPDRAGPYELLGRLGSGGQGVVYLGRDRQGRLVAVKMLDLSAPPDPRARARFAKEIDAARRVAPFCTAQIIFADVDDDPPYVVSEYIEGPTLHRYVHERGPVADNVLHRLAVGTATALTAIHQAGVVHCDLKPDNVVLGADGPRVMDFGIARALASGATTMTQTSAVIGTAQYLSPEQARGEAVDARSDVYAGGCVLFELLCGHPPFVGDSPVSVAYQHVREAPPTPSDINPDVNPAVDAIVLKALSKNPLNRYQSAGEMRADLLRAAAGRPVLATPVMREAETAPMSAAGSGYPTQVVGGAATRQQMPARVGDPRQRRASSWVIATFAALGVLAVIALVTAYLMSQGGTEKIAVPDLTGQTQAAAVAQLEQAGLVPAVGDPIANSTCKKDTVAAQNPPPTAQLEKGRGVTIQLCSGKPEVTIPNGLVGSQFDNVEQQLEALKLKVNKKEVSSSSPEGIVTNVSPKSGTKVAEESTVTVEVSRGNVRQVPNVVGSSADDAKRELEQAGYVV